MTPGSGPEDKRRFQRLLRPFDATWRGASGHGDCRVTDLSLGGCYVQCRATPRKGEETTVTITFSSDEILSFAGRVVYADANMGFAMEFNPLTPVQAERLRIVLNRVGIQVS